MLTTFTLTVFAWIFFRAENLSHALEYINNIFSYGLFRTPKVLDKKLLLIIVFFLIIEWLGRNDKYAIETILLEIKMQLRIFVYLVLTSLIIYFFVNSSIHEFIYFQF